MSAADADQPVTNDRTADDPVKDESAALPSALQAYLDIPSLAGLWDTLRQRLERSGHAIRGSVIVELDDDAAERIAGLLARPVAPGRQHVKLTDLDTALRRSAAGRGLAAVVRGMTGIPLRDLPAERSTANAGWRRVWQALDDDLVRTGLAHRDWIADWSRWLHTSGAVTRLGPDGATAALRAAVSTLAELDVALEPSASAATSPRPIGELASRVTGSAHGLDDGRSASVFVLRAAAIAFDVAPPASSGQRRQLWQLLGVELDLISGTVLVWALRPPGGDAWSAMMRTRADLGLVTHLTVHELKRVEVPLAAADVLVHACENPQVLQTMADAGVTRPVACVSGNPSAAGLLLASRLRLRYHGDFDWPGVAIARRLFAHGARPWRMGAADYRAAVDALPVDARLMLAGRPEPTPWDDELAGEMRRRAVAVHEESLIDTLLADV